MRRPPVPLPRAGARPVPPPARPPAGFSDGARRVLGRPCAAPESPLRPHGPVVGFEPARGAPAPRELAGFPPARGAPVPRGAGRLPSARGSPTSRVAAGLRAGHDAPGPFSSGPSLSGDPSRNAPALRPVSPRGSFLLPMRTPRTPALLAVASREAAALAAARLAPPGALPPAFGAGRLEPLPAAFLGKYGPRGLRAALARDVSSSSPGRHKTSSLPIICTRAHCSASHSRRMMSRRASRSSPNTRTLISLCLASARPVSASTASVRPDSPIITTGSRWWARALSSLRAVASSAGAMVVSFIRQLYGVPAQADT